MPNPSVNAWLLLSVAEGRQHGGNSGYPDVPDSTYVWDSTVPNHGRLAVGDAVVLWDKKRLLGASVIEVIETHLIDKPLFKCPECKAGRFKPRATAPASVRYRCQECQHQFEKPDSVLKSNVTEYHSRHDAGWVDLFGVLSANELRSTCVSPASQHSLRPLRWEAFREALHQSGRTDLSTLERRLPRNAETGAIASGHVLTTVRARIGQQRFRSALLNEHGYVCAVTGPCPGAALEAAHLYSYAELGKHSEHGGLLMRRDIHRLFDSGLIAIEPATRKIDVAGELMCYPDYARMQGAGLQVSLNSNHLQWIESHWSTHRPA